MAMNIELSPEQKRVINNVARNEGFMDYEIEATSGSIKGDGYLGIITTVSVKDKNSNKTLNLILKSSQTNENLRKQAPIRQAYIREIEMYKTVMPEFFNFQNEKGILNPFSGVAKLHGSSQLENNECLVLENLKESGYKLWNRKLPMNSDHVALVFSEYAKFHAISLAFRELQPEKYRKLTQHIDDIFGNTATKEQMESGMERQFKIALNSLGDNEKAKNALKTFEKESGKFFFEYLKYEKDHLVIIHGDCWCNNMMFKYEDIKNTNKPTSVCFLDWQIAKKGSPALDLSYFFIMCSSKEVLYDIDKYLKIYHDAVSENLRNFGCNPDLVFPYSLLEYHWKKYCKFGLFMALLILKAVTGESNEVPDLEQVAESGKQIMEAMDFNSSNLDMYNQRMSDIVVFMTDKGFI